MREWAAESEKPSTTPFLFLFGEGEIVYLKGCQFIKAMNFDNYLCGIRTILCASTVGEDFLQNTFKSQNKIFLLSF